MPYGSRPRTRLQIAVLQFRPRRHDCRVTSTDINRADQASRRPLTEALVQGLPVPPEIGWFANIDNPRTRRAYEADIEDSSKFAGIKHAAEFRFVTRAHVIACRKELEGRGLLAATIRRKLSALSSLFDHLCECNSATVTTPPLCHVTNPSRAHFANCDAVIAALHRHWSDVSKAVYDKADLDLFRRLSHLLDAARVRALQIDLHHLKSSETARRINPPTQVYELVAILIGARSGEKCPMTGTWKLLADAGVTIRLNKGETIPMHEGQSAHWRL